jgi:hypothetical protein
MYPARLQWRSLPCGAAETFGQFRLELEFLLARKSSRNGKRESRTAGETRFVLLPRDAFLEQK